MPNSKITYTSMTYGEAVRSGLRKALSESADVFLMGEDIGHFGGSFGVTHGLVDEFGPERVRDTPISEAGFTGAAVGAAMSGLRPVVEIMFSDFMTLSMDQLVNQAAKISYMYGGQMQVPLVMRTPFGGGTGAGSQHSQSLEAWFCHVPGLKVVAPSTPADAKGLLISAIQDNNPVIFFEHKLLYDTTGPVPDHHYWTPLGKAKIQRPGTNLTLITYSYMVPLAVEVAHSREVKEMGLDIEVVDLRTLAPLDKTTLRQSVQKTGRVAILHEAAKTGGLGGEIAATIFEDPTTFAALRAPLKRICGTDTPIPYSRPLEQLAIPSRARLIDELAFFRR